MKRFTCLALFCLVFLLTGCSEPASKTVTEGADMDAIKAYEASIAALESSQATMETEGKEEPAAAE